MITVLTVFGTRPEAIKLAPVIHALASEPGRFVSRVCVTAQHRQMLDQAMRDFDVSPDYDLNLMRHGQAPAHVAGAILQALPVVIEKTNPDVLVIQGDTITTFAAAFAAYLNRVPVAHVEAGLRSGNFDHPFPEEMNRLLTSRLSTLHFTPTISAKNALLAEGVPESNIFVTGNTVVDSLLANVDPSHQFTANEIAAIGNDHPIVLVTTHRRESFGKPLRNTCHAIRALAVEYTDYQFVLPVHPNPNIQKPVRDMLGEVANVVLCAPLGYRDFVNLMARSRLILTDSGGVQEEAPSLNVPVLVMREATERPEGIAAGCARLVGTDSESIVLASKQILDNENTYRAMASVSNPYGDGTASRQIVNIIADKLAKSTKLAL
jgi:UDP-N-acetylglucosamine 2-epimerase (non-hydrolysing)